MLTNAERYRWWRRFLDQRDAELDSLAEIAVLAQSVDGGVYSYSDERVLKNYAASLED